MARALIWTYFVKQVVVKKACDKDIAPMGNVGMDYCALNLYHKHQESLLGATINYGLEFLSRFRRWTASSYSTRSIHKRQMMATQRLARQR